MLRAMRVHLGDKAFGNIDHGLPIGAIERLCVDCVNDEIFRDSGRLTGGRMDIDSVGMRGNTIGRKEEEDEEHHQHARGRSRCHNDKRRGAVVHSDSVGGEGFGSLRQKRVRHVLYIYTGMSCRLRYAL